MSKPTIVFVPGAWHQASHYATFTAALEQDGYKVLIDTNPSSGSDDPANATAAKDTEAVRKTIEAEVNAGKDVVVLAHSYGGIPAAAAAVGFSKAERVKANEKGGVVGIILVAAFVVPAGLGLLGLTQGNLHPWIDRNEKTGQLTILEPGPKAIFYNDVDDAQADAAVKDLVPQALQSYATAPGDKVAWQEDGFKGRGAYVRTTEDKCLEPELQYNFAYNVGKLPEHGWEVRDLQSGHTPFLSKPDQLKQWVNEWVSKWVTEDQTKGY